MAKPASGATLDTGHALYSGMAAIWAMLEGSGTSSADSKGSNTLTTHSGVSWATDAAGDACLSVATATADVVTLASSIDYSAANNWSIAWRLKKNSNANSNGTVCGDDSTNYYLGHFVAAGYFAIHTAASDSRPTLASATTESDYCVTFSHADSHRFRLYRDGVEDAASPLTAGADPDGMKISTLMSGFTSSTLALEGTLSYFYTWSTRTLTGAEAATLAGSPYAIFSAGSTSNWGPWVNAASWNRIVQ